VDIYTSWIRQGNEWDKCERQHMFLIYLHIFICLEFTTYSPVCSQDRVNGVLPKKSIPFARKFKMNTWPHPPLRTLRSWSAARIIIILYQGGCTIKNRSTLYKNQSQIWCFKSLAYYQETWNKMFNWNIKPCVLSIESIYIFSHIWAKKNFHSWYIRNNTYLVLWPLMIGMYAYI
jgi:hypothetical protein